MAKKPTRIITIVSDGQVETLDLNDKADVTNVYTKNEINNYIANGTMGGGLGGDVIDHSIYYTKDEVNDALDDKADKATTYTKTEVDNKLKNNVSTSVYSKTDVDNKLSTKADKSTTYTKTEVDNKISTKANQSTTYTKTETDNKISTAIAAIPSTDLTGYAKTTDLTTGLASKADKSTVYTKTEIDTKLNSGVSIDTSKYYNKDEVDAKIDAVTAGGVDTTKYYTKTETNAAIQTAIDAIPETDLTGYATTTNVTTLLADKADKTTTYTKTEVDTKLAGVDVSAQLSSYAKTKDVNTKFSNYTTTSDLTTLLASKVNTSDIYSKSDLFTQTETNKAIEDALAVYSKTTYVDTAVNKLTTDKADKTELDSYYAKSVVDNKLSTITTSIASKADTTALTTEISDRKAAVTKVESATNLVTAKVNTITGYISDLATEDNKILSKSEVNDLIMNSSSDAITSNTSGAAFNTLTELKAGPWYSSGVEVTVLKKGDYALVLDDEQVGDDGNKLHNGQCRYNYNGTTWDFYQEFKETTFTTEQTNALNSGATKLLIDKITINETKLTNEINTRSTAITTLTDRIAAEETAREATDTNLATETSNRTAKDTQLQNLINNLTTDKANKADVYSITDTDDKLATKVDKATLTDYVTKTGLTTELTTKANTDDVYDKTTVDSMFTAKIPTDFYSKTETNTKLASKLDVSTFNTKIADYIKTTDVDTKLSTKVDTTELTTNYSTTKDTNKTIDSKIAAYAYSKSETGIEITNRINSAKADYTTTVELNNLLDSYVTTATLEAAVETRKTDEAALKAEVLKTANDINDRVTGVVSDVKSTSDTFSAQLTTLDGKIDSEVAAVKTTISDLTTNVNGVRQTLEAADTALGNRISTIEVTTIPDLETKLTNKVTAVDNKITTINSKIPNDASATNQLADKAYVSDLVAKNAARGLSSTSDGDSFPSKTALETGPWYYQGTSLASPHTNDYAIVTADALNGGNDVRYNYDGAGWVKFQVFQNGAGFDPTSSQLAAMNSGITSAEVTQIATNTTDIAGNTSAIEKEVSDRKTAITEVKNLINTETSTRESVIVDVKKLIADETSAREKADTANTTSITTEITDRTNADDALKVLITAEATKREQEDTALLTKIDTAKSDINTTIGALATLNSDDKTSIVKAINSVVADYRTNYVAKTGDSMSGPLEVSLGSSGDVIKLNAGTTGINFNMDADLGAINIIPTTSPNAGFEFKGISFSPRSSILPYSLGEEAKPWTNAYITNINGVDASTFLTESDVSALRTQVETNKNDVANRVVKTGDEMSGTLKITLPGSGDLIHLEGGGKGVTFSMDASNGHVSLIPVSAPSTGFEFSAISLSPRSSGIPYSLGSSSNPWTNLYATNINGIAVSNLVQSSTLDEKLKQYVQTSTVTTLAVDVASNTTNIATNTNDITTLKSNVSNIYTITQADEKFYNKDEVNTILSDQYNTRFNDLTSTLTNRLAVMETKLAKFDNLTVTNFHFNCGPLWLIYRTGVTVTADIADTNIPANLINWEHDQTDPNNTMTDKLYTTGIGFVDLASGGVQLQFLYGGGNYRSAIKLKFALTGETIGVLYISTGAATGMYNSDITFSTVVYG